MVPFGVFLVRDLSGELSVCARTGCTIAVGKVENGWQISFCHLADQRTGHQANNGRVMWYILRFVAARPFAN